MFYCIFVPKHVSDYPHTLPRFENTYYIFPQAAEPRGRFMRGGEERLPGHVTVSGNPDGLAVIQ